MANKPPEVPPTKSADPPRRHLEMTGFERKCIKNSVSKASFILRHLYEATQPNGKRESRKTATETRGNHSRPIEQITALFVSADHHYDFIPYIS